MGDGDNQYKRFKGFKVLIGDESNPTFGILVDDASKALHICEPADQGTDWNVAANTHPTLYLHSATTPATDYIKLYHDATIGYLDVVGGTTLRLLIAGTAEIDLTASALSPAVTDSNALGTTALMWSDLFLASAGVINFNNGNVTITHSTGLLTLGGGGLSVGASGAGFDVILYGDTATADFFWDQNGDTNGSLTLGVDTKSVDLRVYGTTTGNYLHWDGSADDLLLVGTATQLAVAGTTDSTSTTTGSLRTAGGFAVAGNAFFGDSVYLANGKVINFNAGDVTLTHSSNLLTLAGGGLTVATGQFVSGAPTKQTVTAKTAEATLTAAESGLIEVNTDNITMYLPTYVSNSGLTYTISARATHSAGIKVNPDGTETIDGATTLTSGAQYSSLTCMAATGGWVTLNKSGTWT